MITIPNRDVVRLKHFLHERAGGEIETALSAISSRIVRRAKKLGHKTPSDYITFAFRDKEETEVLLDLLTTHETYFFREKGHLNRVAKHLRDLPYGQKISIWSAACSTGEEVYSLAMVLAETLGMGRSWNIFGSDVSQPALEHAKRATYPLRRLHEMDDLYLKKYCLRGKGPFEGQFRVKKPVTERVDFQQINLCQPISSVGKFDAIFLRNVLIYFAPEVQQEVIGRVSSHLKPGGLLFLGKSEMVKQNGSDLEMLGSGTWRKAA